MSELDGRVRVAAVGDVHFGPESAGRLRPYLTHLDQRADVLLLAGDLTQHGTVEEGTILAAELAGLGVPVIAVLGNHDLHAGAEAAIRAMLEAEGVIVLEGNSVVIDVRGRKLGVAGTKGFGGGFAGACATEFGEAEMKAFVRQTKETAMRLAESLTAMKSKADVRVALTHYAPTKGTLIGEKLEIYPFLGSYLLGEAIDLAGADLAVHGHAHRGVERGVTPGGIPVRNVALPVIHVSYNVYEFGGSAEGDCIMPP